LANIMFKQWHKKLVRWRTPQDVQGYNENWCQKKCVSFYISHKSVVVFFLENNP
jgi:hypothetical protein